MSASRHDVPSSSDTSQRMTFVPPRLTDTTFRPRVTCQGFSLSDTRELCFADCCGSCRDFNQHWSYSRTCVGIAADGVGWPRGQRHDLLVRRRRDGAVDVELVDDEIRLEPPACACADATVTGHAPLSQWSRWTGSWFTKLRLQSAVEESTWCVQLGRGCANGITSSRV